MLKRVLNCLIHNQRTTGLVMLLAPLTGISIYSHGLEKTLRAIAAAFIVVLVGYWLAACIVLITGSRIK